MGRFGARRAGSGRPSGSLVALGAVLTVALGQGAAGVPPPALNGQVEYETFGYPDPDAQGPSWENFFAALVRGKGRLGPTLTYQFEGRAVADDVEFTGGAYSLRNATRRRPYLSLITAAVDYRPLDRLRLSVGKQIVNWSAFDELQPANLITPRDESDVFRRVELGVPGVSVHYGSDGTFAELMVVPLAFTPSRLPQGRWKILRVNVPQVQDLPPVRFDETQAGLRLGTRLGQVQATVVGYVGRDTAAIFVPRVVSVFPQLNIQIVDQYPRLRAGGVTASYPVGEQVLVRAESVYYNSPDRDREDFLLSVAGIEYVLDDWRVVLSYLRHDQTRRGLEELADRGERRFFRSFVFGELRYDPGGRLRGRVRGGYDATGEFLLLQPEVSYRLWRGLRVALAGEVVDAGRRSYFDLLRHEDRLGTRLEYYF